MTLCNNNSKTTMKALINNIKTKISKKFTEIGHRRPQLFDVLTGMFLFWILTIIFSTAPSCTAVPKVIDGALLLIDNEEEASENADEIIQREQERDKESL